MYKSLSKLKSVFFILALCFELTDCTQSPAQIITYHSDSTYVKNSEQNPYVVWVKPGDTVYSIAKNNDVDLRSLIDLNHFNAPYILQTGQRVTLPKPSFHIAKQGENIYAISRIYNTDANSLAAANHLQVSDNLTDGQKLRIPSSITTNSDNDQIRENSESNSQINGVNDSQNKSSTNYNITSNDLPVVQSQKNNDSEENQEPINKSNVIITKSNNNDPSSNKSTSAKTAKPQYYEDDLDEEIISSRKPNKQKTNTIETAKVADNPKNIASSDDLGTNKNSQGKTMPSNNKTPSFIWPVGGKVISHFGPKKGGLYNDGINISAKEGAAVKAADAGTVVYAGNELKGYGNLILIKHTGGYLTAYAHNEELLVKKGDLVKKGQIISHVGQTGLVSSPQLHFSIRQGRKILDPETHLPTSKLG